MNKEKQHTAKFKAIAFFAICMSMFYVLSPMHTYVAEWSHSFSHLTKTHHPKENASVNTHSHGYETHANHHREELITHTHEFIDLFNSFFDSLNSDNSQDDKVPTKHKIDKHIVTKQLFLADNYVYKTHVKLVLFTNNNLKEGYLQQQFKPPKRAY